MLIRITTRRAVTSLRSQRTAVLPSTFFSVRSLTQGVLPRHHGSNRHRRDTDAVATTAGPSPPLRLDPPFTPVPGEAALNPTNTSSMTQASSPSRDVLYICQRCMTPLFHSNDYAASSVGVGRHTSGWPTFERCLKTEGVEEDAIVIRSTTQRTAAAAASDPLLEVDDDDDDASSSASSPRGERGRSAAWLAGYVPHTSMAMARGEKREKKDEMVRRSGAAVASQRRSTSWREACLRDEHKRVVPTILEGCCRHCNTAVAIIGRHGSLVTTASAVTALTPDEVEHP